MMTCSIPGTNIKAFAKALHALAKIGDELYMEPLDKEGLALRTMNSSRSAFAMFKFNPEFFSLYDFDFEGEKRQEFKCKIAMKSAIWTFKSISALEKIVESASIQICPEEDKLKIDFHCKYRVCKTFSINLLECEAIKANFDNSSCRNHFTASSNVLSEAVSNFLANQEELTMNVTPDKVIMKNYIDAIELEHDQKAVHTELKMQPSEFEVFSVSEPSIVTFCLIELRAFLGFTDAFKLSVSSDFNKGGEPIIFSAHWPTFCQATLVMMTIDDEDENQAQSSQNSSTSSILSHEKGNNSVTAKKAKRESMELRQNETVHDAPETHSIINVPLEVPAPGAKGDDVINTSLAGVTPPPSKKAKYIFRKCFEATYYPETSAAEKAVLAPDSDNEDNP